MTEGDWTKLLTKEHVTMELSNVSNAMQFRPCRAEIASPTTDWALSWSLSRLSGIPPDMTAFLWKMLHQLLSTQERLHRLGSSPSSSCKLCKQVTGSLKHELLECSYNNQIGDLLLSCLQSYQPDMSAASLLRLEFSSMESDMQLPATIITAITLGYIWKERLTSSRIRAYQVRSEIEQSINLLRTTRFGNAAISLETLARQMFH